MFEFGPAPIRITVEADQVRRLIAAQFPRWGDLPIRPVSSAGWDNRTFHLGEEFLVRLPSGAEYAQAVDKEHRWLPILAPQLPLPIPVPAGRGEPGEGYPYPWSVYRWQPGEPVRRDGIADLTEFAVTLAGFLFALREIDPTGGPGPGVHNWFRGGSLKTFEAWVERDLATLADRLPVEVIREIWQDALVATWDGRAVWFHGDVASGNLLLQDGRLASVIDFGTCGVGDPSCDLAIAWTVLSGPSRDAFRERLAVDDATWDRGRGWALWKALSGYAGAVRDPSSEPVESMRVINELIADRQRSAVS